MADVNCSRLDRRHVSALNRLAERRGLNRSDALRGLLDAAETAEALLVLPTLQRYDVPFDDEEAEHVEHLPPGLQIRPIPVDAHVWHDRVDDAVCTVWIA